MNIIIIDDDFLITTALKTILEADGEIQVVSTGTDGSDALPLYRRHKPDVVLMDIRMKHMSGLDAANDILNADAQAKILLLTSWMMSTSSVLLKSAPRGIC